MTTTFAPVVVEPLGRLTLVHVLGELDISNYHGFSDALERAADGSLDPILVALVECTYIDTSGLTALVGAHRKFGKRLHVVVPPNSKIRKIFEATGLHRALLLHDEFRAAIKDASSQL
jgi:anti-anti-sigma factor